jgi:hypothetical protein
MDNQSTVSKLLKINSVTGDHELNVQLDDRNLRVAKSDKSAFLKSLLESEPLNQSLVAEIKDDETIEDLHLATHDRVVSIDPDPDNKNLVIVKFETSNLAGGFKLYKDAKNFQEVYKSLKDSLQNKTAVLYSRNEQKSLIQALPSQQTDEPCYDPPPVIPKFDEAHYKPVSETTAEKLFKQIKAQETDPNSPFQGIPFNYPIDGCLGRAHEVCRQIIAQGVNPYKIWLWGISDWLVVDSENFPPQCGQLQWDFHVAAAVYTKNGFRVIDPSLDSEPVSIAKWRRHMKNPAAEFRLTDPHIFMASPDKCVCTSDPKHIKSNRILENVRKAFAVQIMKYGTPPYS